jgi:signal transduction histidine kinase
MRKIPLLLAAATLVPILVLSWLGVRILQQDRDANRQRRRETLEVAAGRLVLDIERRLREIEDQLAEGRGIVLSPHAEEEPPANLFAEAETLEFQKQDLQSAASACRKLTESPKPGIRAAALVRLGRVLRKLGDREGALRAYLSLEQLGSATVAGQPADLLGYQGHCRVLEEARDSENLKTQATALATALESGQWPMDRATFDFYRELVQNWGAPAPSSLRAETALHLRNADLEPRGRRILREKSGTVLAIWNDGRAWLATPGEIEELWNAQLYPVALYDTDGQLIAGSASRDGVSLTPGQTRLPFIINVSSFANPADRGRTVVISGLALAFLAILGAAYGLYRATTREIMLARQQSDFVSAVSHEFRTPLTSLRHLTDLLVSRGVTSEERKTQYYALLANETERLHRMVESLLSFGRIEAGAYAWHLEPADIAGLVPGILEEFRRESQARERQIECDIEEGLPPIRVDREALSRALWNLLENAAKYSPPGSPIRVAARRQGSSVLLAVEDEGSGIPSAERERIFQKFVRGAEAKQAGVRGVGIGLALVKRIMEAHGGSVRLESEPGRGSTFTLVLPAAAL